jgi:FkbM family methyltransferase
MPTVNFGKVRRRIRAMAQPFLKPVRALLKRTMPDLTPNKFIGPFGPYKLDQSFLFSDFASWGELHNRGFMKLIEEACGKRCIYDVGAHVGLTALPLASMSPSGQVVAFEPGERNYELLKFHSKINQLGNLRCERLLVGETESDSGVIFYDDAEVSGMNSIIRHTGCDSRFRDDIPMVTLDGYARRTGVFPDLVKIDVEGYELQVIKGAHDLLRAIHPTQLAQQNLSPAHIKAELINLGYEWFHPDGAHLGIEELEFSEYLVRHSDGIKKEKVIPKFEPSSLLSDR